MNEEFSDEVKLETAEQYSRVFAENDYNYSLDRFAGDAITGLLAYGNVPSYDLAHQAYQMATYMLAVKKGYVYGVSNMGNNP
jgi:hypothetical protein